MTDFRWIRRYLLSPWHSFLFHLRYIYGVNWFEHHTCQTPKWRMFQGIFWGSSSQSSIYTPGKLTFWTTKIHVRKIMASFWVAVGDLGTMGWGPGQVVLFLQVDPSLKLTYSLKIDPCKRRFLLETIIFRGELLVSGRVVPEKWMVGIRSFPFWGPWPIFRSKLAVSFQEV